MATYRFKAVGTALSTHWDRQSSGTRSFVGRKLDPEAGGFVPTDEPTYVDSESPNLLEYRREAREGSIEPFDAETAAFCGLPWSPAPAPVKKPKES